MTEYEDTELCGIWNSFNLVFLTYMRFSIWHKWKKVKVCIKTCTGSEWSQIQYKKLLHYPQATKWSSSMIQRPFKCCTHIYLLTLHLRTSWIHPTEVDHIWSIRIHFQQSKTCQTGIPVPIHNFWKKSLSEDQSPPVHPHLTTSGEVYNTSPTMFVGKTVLQTFREQP